MLCLLRLGLGPEVQLIGLFKQVHTAALGLTWIVQGRSQERVRECNRHDRAEGMAFKLPAPGGLDFYKLSFIYKGITQCNFKTCSQPAG